MGEWRCTPARSWENSADQMCTPGNRILHPAHGSERLVCTIALAADDQIISIVDDLGAETPVQARMLPTQHKPPHVQIRQQRRNGRALRDTSFRVPVDRRAFLATPFIFLFNRGI